MNHRKLAIAIAALGVAASWFLPLVIRGIHDTHAVSVAAEFRIYKLLDPQRIEEMQERYPAQGYSVEQRVRSVGGLDLYMPVLSCVLSGMFAILGVLVYNSPPRSSCVDASTPHDRE